MLLRARFVLPIDGPMIKNGAVRIEHGRIREVGPAKMLDGNPRIDFGDAVILPAFVNAHTHLDLSFCKAATPPGRSFADWLRSVIAARGAHDDAANTAAEAARSGLAQSLHHGVATVGDVTAFPRSVRAVLKHGPLRVISFGEVTAIGTRRHLLRSRLLAAMEDTHQSEHLTIGLSPHAPYSIEPDGIRACANEANEHDLPICMHLAETRDESVFTESGRGPLHDLLVELGLDDGLLPCPKMSPVALAHSCGLLTPRSVLAHCNYVDESDIEMLAAGSAHVAYCPRTHSAFGHDEHPFRRLLAANINVCIGTDSLASNPSLSVLDEVRHVHRLHPEMGGASLLDLATRRGALALGCIRQTGTLTAGKHADLAVVPLDASGPSDPIENLLTSNLSPSPTFVFGRKIQPLDHGNRA